MKIVSLARTFSRGVLLCAALALSISGCDTPVQPAAAPSGAIPAATAAGTPAPLSAAPATPTMSLAEARRFLSNINNLSIDDAPFFDEGLTVTQSNIVITLTRYEVSYTTKGYYIGSFRLDFDLTTLGPVAVVESPVPFQYPKQLIQETSPPGRVVFTYEAGRKGEAGYNRNKVLAGQFAAALNRLTDYLREWPARNAKLQAAVEACGPIGAREATGDVRAQRVLAEAALNEKQFADALDHYEAGLALDPCWADGEYNAALMSDQQHEYTMAAAYMRRYLILAPQAKDAQAARDQITIWNEKAAQQK
ncbi:MAG: tetratricopeptide repeat protein [Stellaceae bacterium]|jgi:tetratricopeptide (TPR) repeat protein